MKFQLPKWLQRDTLTLPPWAKVGPAKDAFSIRILVDTDGYVTEWLKLLGADHKPDQYWLEVAYQCAKLDVQTALVGTTYDPRTAGKSAEFLFSNAPQWALKKFPVGRGTEPASRGREAREHYVRIRGRLPF